MDESAQWLDTSLSVLEDWGSIPGSFKSHTAANSSTLLRHFCAGQALSPGVGPCLSLHASA